MDSKIKDVQNIIESLVHPREKKTDNIQNINQHQQIQNVKQKADKKANRSKKQKKRLSRQQMKDMGMFSLPRKTLKYEDYLELNNLWNGYMENQLGGADVEELKKKFDVTNSQYEMISGLIHKSDLHGAKLKVVQSKCVSLVGHKGIVLLDTKGTFNIICRDNVLRIVPKNSSVFEIKWQNIRFVIYGKHLAARTAERSFKKIRLIRLIDL